MMSGQHGSTEMVGEMLERLSELSTRLTTKEKKCVQLVAQKHFLENSLLNSREETSSAREELQQEATRAALYESRATKSSDEVTQLKQQLLRLSGEREAMDKTLQVVQQQLATSRQQLEEKAHELAEMSMYHSSMSEAKDSSIHSLQQLLDKQEQRFQEQQEVWDVQRQALKATLEDVQTHAVDTVGRRSDQRRLDVGSPGTDGLKQRVLILEEKNQQLSGKCRQLTHYLKEQEKLILRKERKLEELHARCVRPCACGREGPGVVLRAPAGIQVHMCMWSRGAVSELHAAALCQSCLLPQVTGQSLPHPNRCSHACAHAMWQATHPAVGTCMHPHSDAAASQASPKHACACNAPTRCSSLSGLVESGTHRGQQGVASSSGGGARGEREAQDLQLALQDILAKLRTVSLDRDTIKQQFDVIQVGGHMTAIDPGWGCHQAHGVCTAETRRTCQEIEVMAVY